MNRWPKVDGKTLIPVDANFYELAYERRKLPLGFILGRFFLVRDERDGTVYYGPLGATDNLLHECKLLARRVVDKKTTGETFELVSPPKQTYIIAWAEYNEGPDDEVATIPRSTFTHLLIDYYDRWLGGAKSTKAKDREFVRLVLREELSPILRQWTYETFRLTPPTSPPGKA